MLERDSRSHAPSGVFSSSSDGDSIEEASSLAAEKTNSSSHVSRNSNADSHGNGICVGGTVINDKTTVFGNNSSSDPLGNITQTSNNLDFFENTEMKDSSDFLYYGWPEIENFEDVDRMFRSCDSTFGLGTSREDELGWFASSDDIGGTGELVNPDFNYSCPESDSVENLSTDHHSLMSYPSNNAAMMCAPDSSWISEEPDSYMSFVNGSATANGVEGFIPKPEMNEHQKLVTLHNQSRGKIKEHNFGNDSLDYTSKLPNELMQLPSMAKSHQALLSVSKQQPEHISGPDSCNYLQNHLSYAHAESSPLSGMTSVNPSSSAVKTETSELTSQSTRDSSHASHLLLSAYGSHDAPLPVVTPTGTGKREKPHDFYDSRSPVESNTKTALMVVQTTSNNPSTMTKEVHYAGVNPENKSDKEICQFSPAELGSSNIQESSTSSVMDDISLEAASFHQLQLVMEQLDMKTKICIRDSLYRLARSAEQRHNHVDLNGSCEDARVASGALSGLKSFMDIETDTNPIDRSVAHLLFHRPSESSPASAHDSLPQVTKHAGTVDLQ